MNHVLLIAHAPLASALRDAALHAMPDAAPSLQALDVFPDVPPEQSAEVARGLLLQRPRGTTLVLTDALGATPCNVATALLRELGVTVLAGANLPMVLRALNYRREPLAVMAARALEGGTRGVLAVQAETLPTPGGRVS